MGDEVHEVWRMRRAVVRHPVHDWARGPVDQATMLVHRGFCVWGASHLAASLDLRGSHHHLSDITAGLRDRGAGRCLDEFLQAVEQGMSPAVALPTVGGPAAAGPLVDVVAILAKDGTEAARLGAFGLGLVCCGRHQAPALSRLAALTATNKGTNSATDNTTDNATNDTTNSAANNTTNNEADAEAAAGALMVLRAQVTLYDGALESIRQRNMSCHPSAFRQGFAARQPG